MMALREELKLHKARVGPGEFVKTIVAMHKTMFPAWTFEDLLYNPRMALRYTDAIRFRCGDQLPDDVILRRLNNLRKNGTAKVKR